MWSQESADDELDRERRAMEQLDVLVWDETANPSLDRVKEIVSANNVHVGRLKSEIKNREADQIRKSRFFARNSVADMETFHDLRASRYNLVAFYLSILYAV